LHHLVSLSNFDDENKSIESVIAKCTAAFAKARRATNLKKNFDYKIWPHFRSVAHFWAAAYKRNVIEQRGAFPCRPIDLHEFLADAAAYRVRGELADASFNKRRAAHRGSTVKLGQCVRHGVRYDVDDLAA
jgi:hypothetical protein